MVRETLPLACSTPTLAVALNVPFTLADFLVPFLNKAESSPENDPAHEDPRPTYKSGPGTQVGTYVSYFDIDLKNGGGQA